MLQRVSILKMSSSRRHPRCSAESSEDVHPQKRVKPNLGVLKAEQVDPLKNLYHHLHEQISSIRWSECSMLQDCLEKLAIAFQLQGKEQEMLQDFFRFLLLKWQLHDMDGEMLSPTPLMDSIWHHCILSTKFYEGLCSKFRGGFLHHQIPPDTEEEDRQRIGRLHNMRFCFRTYYGVEPLEEKKAEEHKGCHLTLFVKHLTGKVTSINCQTNDTIGILKMRIWLQESIPADQQRIIFSELRHDCDSLRYCGIKDESMVHLVLKLGGC